MDERHIFRIFSMAFTYVYRRMQHKQMRFIQSFMMLLVRWCLYCCIVFFFSPFCSSFH